jgi:hypothetical protein
LPSDIVAKYAGLEHIAARSAHEKVRPVEIARAGKSQQVTKNVQKINVWDIFFKPCPVLTRAGAALLFFFRFHPGASRQPR